METSTDVRIEVEGLRREFGSITALDGVDLATDGPEIVGVVGPSGSGKTTLIRCLLGHLRPTAGQVRIAGSPSTALDAGTRTRIGYMPQREAVYHDLTVRGNVDFFASLYRLPDRDRAVDRALALVELDERADAQIRELSGGMIRRTSLACAIVHDPDVLVLDEPTVGLDPALRASMWEGFRARRDDGAVLLVSTHYLGEAHNCDRVCFLRDGRVLTLDSPDGVRASTGKDDLEGAFLALLDDGEGVAATAGGDDRTRGARAAVGDAEGCR